MGMLEAADFISVNIVLPFMGAAVALCFGCTGHTPITTVIYK